MTHGSIDKASNTTSAEVNQWLELCKQLNVAQDAQEIVDIVVQFTSVSGLHSCTLFYADTDASGQPDWLWTVGEWMRGKNEPSQAIGQRFRLKDFPMSRLWIESTEKPLFIEDLHNDARVDSNAKQAVAPQNLSAMALAPLLQAGRWVGMLFAGWEKPHVFSEDEERLFNTVRVLATATVENLRLVAEKNKALDELKQKLETIERQAQAIQELSTPVIEIWDDVLVMPVVGIVDTRRSKDIMDSLLHRIVETQSKCAIIDVTGVEIVDTMTADYLLKVVRAARLLGARCVLTGLTPAVAQTLVETGASFEEVPTLRNLKEGLRDCLRFLHTQRAQG
jgi:rsbT co-antagonist protein RsbR